MTPNTYFIRYSNWILLIWLLQGILWVKSGDVSVPVDIQRGLLANGEAVTLQRSDPPQCDRRDDSHHRYDPLACWIWNVKAAIPDQKFRKNVFTITIYDMICSNFTIDDIDSEYIPSDASTRGDPSISLSVLGLSAKCIGKYKSTGMSGSVEASVVSAQRQLPNKRFKSNKQNAALGLDVTFVSILYQNHIRMADSVSTSDCQAQLEVPKHNGLKFTGSVSAKFINIFSSSIASYVSSALSSALCPALQPTLEKDLTNGLQEVDRYLKDKVLPNRATDDMEQSSRRRPASRLDVEHLLSLVDWTRDTPVLHTLLLSANRFLDRYLDQGFLVDLLGSFGFGSNVLDDCGYFFRGLNGVARSLTHGTGHVSFQLPTILSRLRNISFVLPKYAHVSVLVPTISLDGADQLTRLNLLRPSTKQTFMSMLKSMGGFNVTIDMEMHVRSIEGGMFQGDPLIESFYMILNTSDVTLHADISVDYNTTGFSKISVGDVLKTVETLVNHNASGVPCVLSPLQSIQFSTLAAEMNLAAAAFVPDGTDDAGQLEKDFDRLLNKFLFLLLGEYETLVSESVTGLISGLGKKSLNSYIAKHIPGNVPSADDVKCKQWEEDTTDLFDFNKHSAFRKMNNFLSNSATLEAINGYITCIADTFNRDVGLTNPTLQSEGFGIELERVALENFGTLDSIGLLSPGIDGFHVRSNAAFGTSHIPTISLSIASAADLLNFSGKLNFSAAFSGVSVDSISRVEYDMNKLRQVKLSNILSTAVCGVLPMIAFSTTSGTSDIGEIQAHLNAVLASSVFNTTEVSLDSSDLGHLTNILRSALLWMGLSVTDSTNAFFASLLPNVESLCYGKPSASHTEERVEEYWALPTVCLVLIILLLAHIVLVFVRLNSNSRNDFGTEQTSPFLETLAIPLESYNNGKPTLVPASEPSLMLDKRVPRVVRHVIPAVVIFTVALLACSNLNTGASVNTVLTISDYPTITLPSLFAFSLGNTTREMYSAGVYSLMAIVVVFSGIWPYMKLLVMLAAWMSPSSEMSQKRRGRLLFLLDALSKFSLVDTFVLVLMIVSFRFHLALPDHPVLDVFVDPAFGFYGFLLATTFSLITGHVALHFHRQSQMKHEPSDEHIESVAGHEYSDGVTRSKWTVSAGLRAFFIFLLGTAFTLIALGATKKSFVFEFEGLAGTLLGEQGRKKHYSLLTLGLSISESVQDPSTVGIIFLQTAYFFYGLVMPLTCLVALAVVMFLPLSFRSQRRALALAEICNAWSAVEVFLLSMIAALFQISTFARFMIGDKCDWIDAMLCDHFNNQIYGEDTCYMVKANVVSNVWYLTVGVTIYSFVASTFLRFAHCALDERYERETIETSKQGDPLAPQNDDNDRTFVQILMQSDLARTLLFVSHDTDDRPLSPCDSQFWEEWWNVCSFT